MEPASAVSILAFLAVIGCGLAAGIFYAFSTFIMAALARLPPAQGAEAMRQINVTVINPLFMVVFMGTALVSAVLVVLVLLDGSASGAGLMLAGALFYLLGCFGVTMVFNVPLNNRLARSGPDTEQAVWSHYLTAWTRWNHVRTLAPVVSVVLLVWALMG
jgi:uncharacterized membrane protein